MRKLIWLLTTTIVTLLIATAATWANRPASAQSLAQHQYLPLIRTDGVGSYGDPPALDGFVETFDGDPTIPESWQPANWDVTVHSRDRDYWYNLEPMQALHGDHCDAPPASHMMDSYQEAVFRCRNHLMTALRASGYGVIYLTPNQLVDFSGQEAVIRFDVSTLRTSKRDWIDLWITPYEDNLQLPLEDWLPDLSGEPRRAIHIRMDFGDGLPPGGSFEGAVINNFEATDLPQNSSAGYETVLTPSATQRQTYELRISSTHVKFGLPAYNLWWIDTSIANLGWNQGVVQFGHHSYNPMKNCTVCSPNTWHWDNINIAPAVPFTIIRANHRYANEDQPTVSFSQPAPAGSRLRFAGIGDDLEVSFNGGTTWQAAQLQAHEEYKDESFHSFWTPIPAGTTSVRFRGQEWWGGDWHARDISIWSLQQPPNGIPDELPAEPLTLPIGQINNTLTLVCDLPAPIQVQ